MSEQSCRDPSHQLMFLDDARNVVEQADATMVAIRSPRGSYIELKLPRHADILKQVQTFAREAWTAGYAQAQADIRDALGVVNCDCAH